jgi:hypothetical protein
LRARRAWYSARVAQSPDCTSARTLGRTES